MHGDLRADTAAVGRIRRADDVLDMQRAARKGGTGPVLRWLAGRTGATVFLMNSAVLRPTRPRSLATPSVVSRCAVRES
jgi:hypothetical protein